MRSGCSRRWGIQEGTVERRLFGVDNEGMGMGRGRACVVPFFILLLQEGV